MHTQPGRRGHADIPVWHDLVFMPLQLFAEEGGVAISDIYASTNRPTVQ